MEDFDKLWNYDDPAGTEAKFRVVLKDSSPDRDLSYHLQLLTQIARTYSLRFMFDEAFRTLDEVQSRLPAEPCLAAVRYHLELGRTYNWNKQRAEAKEHFLTSRHMAEAIHADRYTVDAIHMLAIIAPPDESARLNEEAILFAENSDNEQARRWLGTLCYNLGWSYYRMQEFEKSLSLFIKVQKYWEERNAASSIFLSKWCVAKTLRVLNRHEEALAIQSALLDESAKLNTPDGYVHEELGELFLIKMDTEKCTYHFRKAWELLSTDKYLQEFEKERLERIKSLSEEMPSQA